MATAPRTFLSCLFLVTFTACRESPMSAGGVQAGDGSPQSGGSGGGAAGTGGSGPTGSGGSPGGSGGAAATGGAAGAGSGGAGGTVFCGLETCGPLTRCCPSTGRCYDPKTGGCVSVGCAVAGCSGPGCPDAGPVDPGACCKMSGLVYCPTTQACHHPGCQNCCPPDRTCNQHGDCPGGLSCCFSARRCYNPLTADCDAGPPARCDAGGRCPGNFVCCSLYGTCHDPACKDCCLASCSPASAPCTQRSCCAGLECCSGIPVPPGAEYCGQDCPISDRNAKRDIVPADGDEILRRVTAMPISVWSYKEGQPSVRHIGPMAQDFHAAFGTGESDRCIPTVDANGVALAAIQALSRRVEQLDQATRELREQNTHLREEVTRLRKARR